MQNSEILENLIINRANKEDLEDVLKLYTQLHNNQYPIIDENINALWNEILTDKNHYILTAKYNNQVVSSCVLIIIPNLTHNQRPYAFIENVITDEKFRNKGIASKVLNFAKNIAMERNCYKIMLLTGSKKKETLKFYQKAGFNCDDKTGFIMWIEK